MTPPKTTISLEKLLDSLGRSGLLAKSRVQQIAHSCSPNETASSVIDRLVTTGELTRFQGQKLLLGQWAGLILGSYRILSPLGRGGSGVVYLAREQATESKLVRPLLALKVLPRKKANEERVRDRFHREMLIGKYIPAHSHLPRVYDSGEVNGIAYIAMEYVPGRTIKEILADEGPMPHGEAGRIFADIAEGLAAMHAVGVIHRDVKPSNILVTPGGSAKLIDYGFALVLNDDLPRDRALVGGRGYILGSMDYIAPEQAADATDVSARSDLYSLGATLYYALTGCPPFPGGTAIQKINWHRYDSPPPIRSIRPDIPKEFAAVVTKLMAKDPDERYASATHCAEVLKQWATMPVVSSGARLVEDRSELSTDEVLIDEPPDEASEEFVREEPVTLIPKWLPWAIVAGIVFCFLLGYALKRLIN
jgi:eukaryotic-like serine/threonine-protein kinase